MKSNTKALILILICVSLWALIPVVAKLGQATLDNHQFLFWSSLVSFLVLSISSVATGGVKDVRGLSARDWIKLVVLGLLGTYIFYLLLYLGYARAIGMEVLVFQYTWPILIVVFSIFILRERITTRKAFALGLGFAGVLAVLTRGDLSSVNVSNPEVIGLVAAGSASFALFSVLSKNVDGDAVTLVSIYFLTSCIASFVSMVFFSGIALPTAGEILPILLNGVLINGFSYLLWIIALRTAEASYLAPLTFITPVLSAIYLVVFFDEPFYAAYAVGLICIVAGGLVNSVVLKSKRSG